MFDKNKLVKYFCHYKPVRQNQLLDLRVMEEIKMGLVFSTPIAMSVYLNEKYDNINDTHGQRILASFIASMLACGWSIALIFPFKLNAWCFGFVLIQCSVFVNVTQIVRAWNDGWYNDWCTSLRHFRQAFSRALINE